MRMLTRSHQGERACFALSTTGFDEAFGLVAASNWHKSTIGRLEIRILVVLRVTEIFRSIQGESTHAGRPCTFVRLTGCPMRCSQLVEVTGGEPLAQRQSLDLIRRLCDDNHEVLIETGGYVSTEEVDSRAKIILDVKCPASGEAERNHWPNLNRLRPDKDEVKFVIADAKDWEFAKRIIEDYQLESRAKAILISPAWDQIDLQELANWIVQSGLEVRMQLQLHKYIWGPDVHGV